MPFKQRRVMAWFFANFGGNGAVTRLSRSEAEKTNGSGPGTRGLQIPVTRNSEAPHAALPRSTPQSPFASICVIRDQSPPLRRTWTFRPSRTRIHPRRSSSAQSIAISLSLSSEIHYNFPARRLTVIPDIHVLCCKTIRPSSNRRSCTTGHAPRSAGF